MILTRHRTFLGGGLLAASMFCSLGCSTGPGVNRGSSVPSSQPIAAHTATIEVLGLT